MKNSSKTDVVTDSAEKLAADWADKLPELERNEYLPERLVNWNDVSSQLFDDYADAEWQDIGDDIWAAYACANNLDELNSVLREEWEPNAHEQWRKSIADAWEEAEFAKWADQYDESHYAAWESAAYENFRLA